MLSTFGSSSPSFRSLVQSMKLCAQTNRKLSVTITARLWVQNELGVVSSFRPDSHTHIQSNHIILSIQMLPLLYTWLLISRLAKHPHTSNISCPRMGPQTISLRYCHNGLRHIPVLMLHEILAVREIPNCHFITEVSHQHHKPQHTSINNITHIHTSKGRQSL